MREPTRSLTPPSVDNMLQYLNILLDDKAVSYCHYDLSKATSRPMPLDILKKGIRFAMMENLMIQFVFPSHPLPEGYEEVVESIDHFNIKDNSSDCDVLVVDGWGFQPEDDTPVVLRTTKEQLFAHCSEVKRLLQKVKHLSIVIIDVDTFSEEDFDAYRKVLDGLVGDVTALFKKGLSPQLNIITDRMVLKEMNNCGAGDTNITLAPNGKFYICPAFYHENEEDCIGDLEHGLDIKNPQLYRLDYAPICRHCDAWQCRRCVWMNKKTTLEVNTPSRQQCVVAHLERNASRQLLMEIRKHGTFLPDTEIGEIDYLDPFDKRDEW